MNAGDIYRMAIETETGIDTIAANPAFAAVLYRKAAELGYAPAQNYLGFMYYNGNNVKENVDSTIYWVRAAAMQGDVKGAGNLGYLLTMSDKIPHDFEEGIKWLEKASDAGLPTAQVHLADIIREGKGVTPDTLRASTLYLKALRHGLKDAELKFLKMMETKWNTLPADSLVKIANQEEMLFAPRASFVALDIASDKGNTEAMRRVGEIYSHGTVVAYDRTKAMSLFLKAALAGDAKASLYIGETLEIFPDLLKEEWAQDILNAYFYPTPISSDIYFPSYWYKTTANK